MITLYVTLCTKFGQLVIRKIIEIVDIRCHNLRLKCTKFDFRWGIAPDPAGGAYSAPRPLLLDLRGLFPREGRRGRERGWEGRKRWERAGRGREGHGKGEVGRGVGNGKGGNGRKGTERKGGMSVPANKNLRLHPWLMGALAPAMPKPRAVEASLLTPIVGA